MCALVSAPLIERETYLERLDALLDGAQSGNGGCVLVEGPPGVGKTSLLAAVVRSAEARGLRSLRASGGELERDFAYGVVRQLFERHVRSLPTEEVDQLLGGAARLAAPALGVEQPGLPATGLDAPFAANERNFAFSRQVARQPHNGRKLALFQNWTANRPRVS